MKVVDTQQYISMLRELLEAGQTVSLPVAGNSMLPFLADKRDSVTLRRADSPLKVGDIALYQRENEDFILHRVCRVTHEGFFAVGDAQQLIEGPLGPGCVLGRVTAVRRKEKILGPGSFWWEFFEHIWIRMIPVRRRIMGLYGNLFSRGKGAGHE